MEDPHEPVRQSAERLVMRTAAGSLTVVVGPGAGRPADRREGPQVARVGKTTVADVPGEDHDLGPGGPRDRSAPRVAPSGAGIWVAARVVPELTEHPAGEDGAEAGEAPQDLGVGVLAETLPQLRLDGLSLG